MTMVARVVWSDAMAQRLRDLWTSGWTARQIASVLGVTANAVTAKAKRCGLSARPSPVKVDALLLDRFAAHLEDGKTIRAAAETIGYTEATGNRWFGEICRRLGWQAS